MERDMYGRFKSSRRGEPKWIGVAMYVLWTAAMWWLFGWPAGVTLVVVGAGLSAVCMWQEKRKKAEG